MNRLITLQTPDDDYVRLTFFSPPDMATRDPEVLTTGKLQFV